MQTATQPLEAPGAGTATQPVQAPGSVPDGQATCEVDLSAASDSEADQLSVTGSLDDEIHRDRSPDRDVTRDETDQEPTEEANYRETMRGVRSFMNWHKIPEFETVSSAADDNPFAGAHVQPTGKVCKTPCGRLVVQENVYTQPHNHRRVSHQEYRQHRPPQGPVC